jgi:cyclomaltodextrinase
MEQHWCTEGLIYQFYPMGICGAPHQNDFQSAPVERLSRLEGWIDHLAWMGAKTVLLGPVFESGSHGYDTADYFQVDRRLGTHDTLKRYSAALHQRGMRLVLDGVFNHVGRNFWAFRDVQVHGQDSAYTGWFEGIDFSKPSPYQDAFDYQGWNGHYSLVKLNLVHPDVRNHLFEAVASWVREFDIDGLRLDAVESISPDFIAALAAYCRPLKKDFWLIGEVVHGDYRKWAAPGMLDSVTNYEVYKGLYSSLNDATLSRSPMP